VIVELLIVELLYVPPSIVVSSSFTIVVFVLFTVAPLLFIVVQLSLFITVLSNVTVLLLKLTSQLCVVSQLNTQSPVRVTLVNHSNHSSNAVCVVVFELIHVDTSRQENEPPQPVTVRIISLRVSL
jgi:hypothetical protein